MPRQNQRPSSTDGTPHSPTHQNHKQTAQQRPPIALGCGIAWTLNSRFWGCYFFVHKVILCNWFFRILLRNIVGALNAFVVWNARNLMKYSLISKALLLMSNNTCHASHLNSAPGQVFAFYPKQKDFTLQALRRIMLYAIHPANYQPRHLI